MIKNIPNKNNSAFLRAIINIQFKDKFNFFYLPEDFLVKNKYNFKLIF
jgi:hypothetical protein